jgi:hypothetical protein
MRCCATEAPLFVSTSSEKVNTVNDERSDTHRNSDDGDDGDDDDDRSSRSTDDDCSDERRDKIDTLSRLVLCRARLSSCLFT